MTSFFIWKKSFLLTFTTLYASIRNKYNWFQWGDILKDTLAIICGKFVYRLGKKFTPCSSLPGKIALNFENLYKNFDKIKDLSRIEIVTRV